MTLGFGTPGLDGLMSGIVQSAAIKNRKLKESSRNAHAAPSDFIITPAGLGAATPANNAVLCQTEFAAGNCGGSTSDRIIAGAEGIANASAMPKPVASTYTYQMLRCPPHNRHPIAPTRIARAVAAIIIN